MKSNRIGQFTFLIALVMLVNSAFAVPVNIPITTTYSAITGYGRIASLSVNLAASEKLVKSSDGLNFYRVRTVSVRDEAQLLRLMGAATEAELTDMQRGLLETYRFTATQGITDLKPRLPERTESINLNLVDITGYTDTSRYTRVKEDFWPQNSGVYRHNGTAYKLTSDIRISGTDCLGYGPDTAKAMKSTFAHEFGHSLDLTSTQSGAYGFDNAHYVNEKIETKASFAEGFANFIKMLFFPEEETQFRETLQKIKIEKPEGGYDEYPIANGRLVGEGYLDVEAVNTLIFTRLSAELPNGKQLVLDSFQKHNQSENRMSKFMQNFIKDYPMHAETVASILNRETLGKLSDAEIRQILGSSVSIERFIANRSINQQLAIVEPPVAQTPVASQPDYILPVQSTNGKTPKGSGSFPGNHQPQEPTTLPSPEHLNHRGVGLRVSKTLAATHSISGTDNTAGISKSLRPISLFCQTSLLF